MPNIERLYSDRAGKMRKSVIRELLKVAQDPEIISFAGGLPNPKSFPTNDLSSIILKVMKNHSTAALQYGTTQGYDELRKQIAERSLKEGMKDIDEDNIIITNGSQQALDTVGLRIDLWHGENADQRRSLVVAGRSGSCSAERG